MAMMGPKPAPAAPMDWMGISEDIYLAVQYNGTADIGMVAVVVVTFDEIAQHTPHQAFGSSVREI